MTSVKTCCAGLAAGAALLVAAAPSPAAKDKAAGSATVSIKLKGTGKTAIPYFKGPKTVKRGATLSVKNFTKVQEIGPHSFSLVKPALIPKGKKAVQKCGGGETAPPAGLCLKLAKAHKVDLQSGKVGKPSLEAGRKGWDTSFGKKGDSWVSQDKGDNTSRKVTAKAGTTLTYFCAVHPFMVGHIKVVK